MGGDERRTGSDRRKGYMTGPEEDRGDENVMEMGAKTAGPTPMDRLESHITQLEEVVNVLNGVGNRVHNNLYGEYQDNPQVTEETEVDQPGRVEELMRRVRQIRETAQLNLRIMESVESKG